MKSVSRKQIFIMLSSIVTGIVLYAVKIYLMNVVHDVIKLGFVDISIVRNYGYISGFLSDSPLFISVFQLSTVAIALYMLYMTSRKNSKVHPLYLLSPWMMLAGFVGNAISWFVDGYIIDYVKFNIPGNNYYTNCEDVLIEIGTILFICQLIFRNETIERIYRR